MLPRQEVYTVCSERHMLAIDYIKECEQAWIGKTVIARRDSDTLFHPGEFVPSTMMVHVVSVHACRRGYRNGRQQSSIRDTMERWYHTATGTYSQAVDSIIFGALS